jgi:RHS repeat-associated protein
LLSAETHWGNHEASGEESSGRSLDNFYRTYDPATGRYLEPDPLGQQGSLNVYSYAFANPLHFVDPRADRPLSEAERNFAVDYFGGNFNLDGIDLDASRWLNWPNAIRPGDIRLPSDYFIGSDPCADVNLDDAIVAALFAHELLHEWQRQHGASVFWSAFGEHLVATFTPGTAYDYDESEDPQALLETFLNGGVEQQGQIWQDFVRTERKNLPTNRYREVFHRVRGY